MPIKVQHNLPAVSILNGENIFVMTDERAESQDIRPLKIAILNIMPTKIVTETQLLRLLGNSPLQVEITLLHPASHEAKNVASDHLDVFYKTIDHIENERFDGLIITGAPVETIPFEAVDYWSELEKIMDWSSTNVYSTMHICWGAQAGLYYRYGINKYPLEKKMFGVFKHNILDRYEPLVRGFDDVFYAPHSRHTEILQSDISANRNLKLLATSDIAGVHIVIARSGREIYITGHSEYDPLTLKSEYDRDIAKGLAIDVPCNYYPEDNPENHPEVKWRSAANLLFSNWLNYYVYQETPFDLTKL